MRRHDVDKDSVWLRSAVRAFLGRRSIGGVCADLPFRHHNRKIDGSERLGRAIGDCKCDRVTTAVVYRKEFGLMDVLELDAFLGMLPTV